MKTGYLCRKPMTSAIWQLPYARDFGKVGRCQNHGRMAVRLPQNCDVTVFRQANAKITQ